jgi:hypothetical protein
VCSSDLDASGEMTMKKVGKKPLHQDMLNSAVSKTSYSVYQELLLASYSECIFICLHDTVFESLLYK